MLGGSSAPDPFPIAEFGATSAGVVVEGYKNTVGRLQKSSVLSAGTKVIVIGGQSNHCTSCGSSTYTTVSSLAQNLNIYDGGIYAGADPVLGCGSGGGPSSLCMRLADSLISRGKATRCIVVPVAIGGTPYNIWTPAAAGSLFNRISTAILRCRARGLEPDYFIWGDGETDNINGTSAASITASIQAIVAGIRALSCVAPFYPGLYTMNGGATSSTIRTGITNAVSAPSNIVLGYDADTNCPNSTHRLDGTHFNDTGLSTAATGWSTLIAP